MGVALGCVVVEALGGCVTITAGTFDGNKVGVAEEGVRVGTHDGVTLDLHVGIALG